MLSKLRLLLAKIFRRNNEIERLKLRLAKLEKAHFVLVQRLIKSSSHPFNGRKAGLFLVTDTQDTKDTEPTTFH